MQTTIKDQIKAVQVAKKHFHINGADSLLEAQLNDAASTLAAINMIMSGDIGKEFMSFRHQNGNLFKELDVIFIDFLAQKGLKLK